MPCKNCSKRNRLYGRDLDIANGFLPDPVDLSLGIDQDHPIPTSVSQGEQHDHYQAHGDGESYHSEEVPEST